MSTGKEIREIPEEACIKAQQEDFSKEAMEPYVRSLFTAVLRRLHNGQPEFAEWNLWNLQIYIVSSTTGEPSSFEPKLCPKGLRLHVNHTMTNVT